MSARVVLQLARPVRSRLERITSKNPDLGIRIRARVVLLYQLGWSAPRIAEALGCVPATWVLAGTQKLVVTPGQNKKRYIAGALAVGGTDLVFVQAERKNSALFVALLEKLRVTHRKARRIHLVLENYAIHSSRAVREYLADLDGLFVLHFLPPYSPEHNAIKRQWRDVHANVTRNHRCRSIDDILRRVKSFLIMVGTLGTCLT